MEYGGFKMDKINIISNMNTINLKELKANSPLSYAYLCLSNNLNNSGMQLRFINQDKNRVYFRVFNKINKYLSSITELNNSDLLSMNIYDAGALKSEIWNKTI